MRGRLRSSWRAAAACLLVVLMTGCIKLNMDLKLQSDDTVNGSVIFALNKQILQLTGKSFDDLTGGQSVVPSGVPVQSADYEDDQYSGKEYTFEGVPISRFSGDSSDGSLSIVHQGDTFVVNGSIDFSTADTSQLPNADQLLSSADLSIAITFPGAVQSASPGGVISGNTVTWTPKFGQKNDIQAVGSSIGSGGGSTLLWILVAVAVAIGVVVALLFFLARRTRKDPAEGEGEMAMAGVDPAAASVEAAVPPPPPMPADEPGAEPSAEPGPPSAPVDEGPDDLDRPAT